MTTTINVATFIDTKKGDRVRLKNRLVRGRTELEAVEVVAQEMMDALSENRFIWAEDDAGLQRIVNTNEITEVVVRKA